MESFVAISTPMRVVFGAGTIAKLAEEAQLLGIERALILSTPQQVEHAKLVRDALEGRDAGAFAGAVMHTPIETTERAIAQMRDMNTDGLVSIGGGSTIGLGKAIALRTGQPHICIPTTYAGSEMTPILGETADGVKTTIRDLKILPKTVIYDVDLTLGLPATMSGVSGLNAIAHSVEGLYAQDGDPIVRLMAEEGIRALYTSLPTIVEHPHDAQARSDALYGAWLCGVVLGRTSMALHHKLCHVLGGSFNLPHAETHAIVLPHALQFNARAVPEAITRLRRALGENDPAAALFHLNARFGGPTALRDIGMPQNGINRAVELALRNPYWNPRPLAADDLLQLITNIWSGTLQK